MKIRKRWLKEIVENDRRWRSLQEAVGMELIQNPLGCGHFGCAFAPTDPESPWVVKVTSDPHEAEMWIFITTLSEKEGYGEDGYTRVREVVRLLPDAGSGKRKKRLHAIVREAIAPVFSFDGRPIWSEFSRQVVSPAELPDTFPFFSLEKVDRPARDLVEVISWISKYHASATYIYAQKKGRINREWSTSLEREKDKLLRSIDMMKTGYGYVLGDTLELLWNNGVVLNDLHINNVGWRFHPDFLPENEDNVLVLFDPGFTATGRRQTSEIRQAMIANPGFEWYVDQHIAR